MLKIKMKTEIRTFLRPLYLGLIVAPALLGCGADVVPDYTRQQPKRSDIVGLWVLTPESAQDMKVLGKYKSNNTTIQIKDDGTFSAVNLPDCAYSHDNRSWDFNKGKLLTVKGTWNTEQRSFKPFFDVNKADIEVWDLILVFNPTNLGSLPPDPYPILLNQEPPFTIHIPFGDPDAEDQIDLVRVVP